MQNRNKVGFLLVGGIHHILHLIPVISALQHEATIESEVFVRTLDEANYCRELLSKLGANNVSITVLKTPKILTALSPKLSSVLWHIKKWKHLDGLVMAERTSTILRYFTRPLPKLIHIPHGAAGRGRSYDKRIRHFHHVIVAGFNFKRRLIELGITTEEKCSVAGHVKSAALARMSQNLPKLFKNDRPIVLYNPHFDQKLASWSGFGEALLKAFSSHTEFNFIIAPHIRLYSDADTDEKKRIEAYGQSDNILVDLGSEKSTDMTYTRASDIYLGDVSSQVYEFLIKPKPCVFIDAHNTNWEHDPDYAFWHYGKVCRSVNEVLSALQHASRDHEVYKAAQIEGSYDAMGDPNWDPIQRTSDIIAGLF